MKSSRLKSFLVGFVIINLLNLLAFFLLQFMQFGWIMLITIIIGIVCTIGSIFIYEKWGMFAMLGTIIGAIGFFLSTTIFMSVEVNPTTIKNISVKDAPQYADYDVFHFMDGKPHPTIYGYHYRRYYVNRQVVVSEARIVPVVTDDWTIDQPITLWISCPETLDAGLECSTASDRLYRAGINLGTDEPGHRASYAYYEEKKYAARKFGITFDPNSPVITWVPNPEAVLAFNMKFALGTVIFINLSYLVACLIAYRKQRSTMIK